MKLQTFLFQMVVTSCISVQYFRKMWFCNNKEFFVYYTTQSNTAIFHLVVQHKNFLLLNEHNGDDATQKKMVL